MTSTPCDVSPYPPANPCAQVLAQPTAEEAAQLPRGGIPTYDEKADVWSLGALVGGVPAYF